MNNRRIGLGRGLDALFPSSSTPANLDPAVQEVDVDLIGPNPHQPRTVFDPDALTELAESIKEHGVIQPLIVTRPADRSGAPYHLIAGERRLLASRQAGLKKVPVIVKEASPQALLELALVENLQRQDLGPLEEAFAFKRLADEFMMTQESIATRVGRSRSSVTNSLRLLSLPPEIQNSLARNEITAGHARALLGIEDRDEQIRTWRRIVEGNLTVRDAEQLARDAGNQAPPPLAPTPMPRRRSAEVASLEEHLRSSLGTKVDLKKGRKGGTITIHFFSDEELNSILDHIN
ncbi:MAG: ParB/RepB/Spo0J family partition protein [Dehalococcoidia bacterium]